MATDLVLNDNNQKQFEQSMTQGMDQPVKHFERELITIRTGRAHPALVESVKIPCYGGASMMPLKQLATISAPDPHVLSIEPWDKSIVNDIVKAISASDLGITPDTDGSMIYVKLPKMSAERREELFKILGKKTEEAKVAIRNVRKEYHNLIRSALKNKDISEDHSRRLTECMEKLTNKYINECDYKAKLKEKEIKG